MPIPARRILPLIALLAMASPAAALAAWPASGFPVATGAGDQSSESIVSDGAGGALVAWWDTARIPYRVRLTRISDSGALSPGWPASGVDIAGLLGWTGSPQAVTDGAGGAFVVWVDGRAPTSIDLYAQHILADGSIAPGWVPFGLPVCEGPGGPQTFSAIADDAGGIIVAWYDNRDGATGIYAVRMDADGAVHAGWATNGTQVSFTGPTPLMVADGTGGAIFGWNYSVSSISNVFALRLLGDGTIAPGWPSGGVPICPIPPVVYIIPPNQFLSSMCTDGLGGAFFAFQDYRANDNRVHLYGQRITAAGTVAPGWPVTGYPVSIAPQNQDHAQLVPDGSGGAIYVWQDWRVAFPPDIPNNTDIYAQRMSAGGVPQWATNGIPLCDQISPQWNPAAVPDPNGGAYVAWVDYRSGQFPVFATHIDAGGQPVNGWPVNGASIEQPLVGGVPSMAPDGMGGAVVGWHAYTLNGADVFATRLVNDGPVAAEASLVSAIVEDGRVRIRWQAAVAAGTPARIERDAGAGWVAIAETSFDGTGSLVFEDRGVVAGGRYRYRLVLDGGAFTGAEASVEIPRAVAELAIARLAPNPASGPVRVELALPSGRGEARLELIDLAGRVIESRTLAVSAGGSQVVTLGAGASLPPGLYHVRITQGHASRTRSLAIVR